MSISIPTILKNLEFKTQRLFDSLRWKAKPSTELLRVARALNTNSTQTIKEPKFLR